MDMDTVKAILQYAPFAWFFKKQDNKLNSLEKRVSTVERATAIVETKVDAIREDIHEIKHGVEKLVDRL